MCVIGKTRYVLGKVLQLLFFMTALTVIVFTLARLAPGDPLYAYYGDALDRMSIEQREAAMTRLSLDKPMTVQYFTWGKNALHGDFGVSYIYKQPVLAVIGKLWLNTVLLGGSAYVLTFLFSTLLSLFCAKREGTFIDAAICKIGTVTSLIPTFFVALICILVFSVELKILPSGGAYSIGKSGDWANRAIHLILPVFVLILSHLWYYAYILRNKLIDELSKDYVTLLRVKKLTNASIMRHCLKNCLPSLITIMSISLPHIIAGTYIVELVFGYPGLGSLAFESARYKDYNMLSVITLITGFAVIVSGILGQELSAWLDPAMRHDEVLYEKA